MKHRRQDAQSGGQHPSGEAPGTLRLHNVSQGNVLGDAIEVADRGPKRRKGLLGRTGLPPGGGLWIVPCEAVHTFGMQFPIDIVYVDRQMRVKKVSGSVGPWRLSGCLTAHSVLELPAGTVSRTGTKPGDTLAFSSAAVAHGDESEHNTAGHARSK